jgi:cytidyltransferase-like protein
VITVYTDIVGDLFHYGHVNLLAAARALGDRLVVGVCDDDLVASYKRRPVFDLDERTRVIAACRHVDAVVPGCPCPVTREFIDAHGIDLVARGDDLDAASMAHWYAVPMQMGILRLLPYTREISSSIAIGRILDRDRA